DRQGNFEGTIRGLRGARCTCNASRKSQVPDCPQCGTAWRGEGDGGGRVVAAGTPEQVARCRLSHTGRFLRGILAPA
ncbi:MAG TPA: hypothetical protein PKW12_05085, partial [Verrucomicrobiota bacterium]|nr:hypothetical protein [Verrucomicrobiota bacterium]